MLVVHGLATTFQPAPLVTRARAPAMSAAVADEQYRTVKLIDTLKAADFQHPTDREVSALLGTLAPVEALARQAFKALNIDDTSFLDNIARGVLVGPDQLPELHADLVEACRLLNVDVAPELYVRQDPRPNAYTLAVQGSRPFIVVTTSLLDLLEPVEIKAVIAHELGHLKCEHGLVILLANVLSTLVLQPSLGTVLDRAALSWQRAAELSCDRAALVVTQDPRVVQSVMMKLTGGSRRFGSALNVDAFLRQAAAYDEAADASRMGRMVRRQQTQQATHPLPIFRARELEKWASSAEYAQLLARGKPIQAKRRGEEGI